MLSRFGSPLLSLFSAAAICLIALSNPSNSSAQLSPRGLEFQINTYTTGDQTPSSVASLDGDEFMVVWTRDDGDGDGVFGQRVDRGGTAIGSELQLNPTVAGSQSNGRLASMGSEGSVVAYTLSRIDIRVQRLDPSGIAVGNQFDPSRVTFNFEHSVTATPDGGFIVLWRQNEFAGDRAVMRFYDSQGAASGGAISISNEMGERAPVAATLDSGDFLVAWQNNNDRVTVRPYGSDGQPLTGSYRLDDETFTAGTPVTAAMPSGPFFVAWREDGGDGDSGAIFARLVGSDSLPIGDPFMVNSYTTGDQRSPAVASLDDGFLVSWVSEGQDGDGGGIYGQQYLSDGQPVGGEIRLNSSTVGNQADVFLSQMTNGRLLATWSDDNLDGDGAAVAARIFARNEPPVALPDAFSLLEDSSFSGNVVDGSLGGLDTDFESDPITALLVTGPASGSLLGGLSPDGSFTYSPSPDFNGQDSFTYRATDGTDGNIATVSITVTPVNDPPGLALPSRITTNQAPQSIPGYVSFISAGPDDEASQQLSFSISDVSLLDLFSSGPEISSDGTLTFTPSGLVAESTLRITLMDDGGTAFGGRDSSPPLQVTIEVVDEFAPQVLAIETPSGALGACSELRQAASSFTVAFNEAMANPSNHNGAGDISNPANYQLIGAGDDRRLDTVSCGGLLGDDLAIIPASVHVTVRDSQATLHLETPLQDDLYRVLVCETLEDAFGNALGEAAATSFRQTADNEFVNGHFDCSLHAWAPFPVDDVLWASEDAGDSVLSGSAWLPQGLEQPIDVSQCVDTVQPSFRLSGRLRVDALPGDLIWTTFYCTAYEEAGCTGEELGGEAVSIRVGPTAGWLPFDVRLGQDGGASVVCGASSDLDQGDLYTAYFDDFVLRTSLFSDDFETGDTSRWEATVP